MSLKNIACGLLIGFILLSFNLRSAELPINTIGCMIINDGFLASEPQLLTTTPAILSSDTTKILPVYHHKELTITIGTATFIQAAMRRGWISSFKLIVQQTGKDTIMVKSSPRANETETMNTYLTIKDYNTESGELIIECNAH